MVQRKYIKELSGDGYSPDVVILCGGKGTRLSSVVSDRPKSLAEVGDGVFLDILLQKIFDQGFARVILAVGHLKEKITERYGGDPRIVFSIEESPLGTGGAVAKAMELVKTKNFIVMNGDCHCGVDLSNFYCGHLEKNPLASFVLAEVEDISDFGSVRVGEGGRILAFEEKIPEKRPGLVNAGIYIFDKKTLNYAPKSDNFSLEKDLFPVIIKQFCYGHVIPGGVLDIGTPERYELAKKKFGKAKK